MDAENIFKTICAGFNSTPEVCFPDYDEAAGKRTTPGGGIGKGTVIAIIIIAIAINVLLIYCYRRYTKREMKEEMQLQISSMMSQYFALNDSKGGAKIPNIGQAETLS